jgi:carbonic anhydrase
MNRLISVTTSKDISPNLLHTPIGFLLEYHNLLRKPVSYTNAQILIGMCMDNRKHLRIPDNFAYIIRSGGGNLRYSAFKVSYAIAVGNIRYIAIIAHNNCGMVNLLSRKSQFINGLIDNAGWDKERAEEHFMRFAPMFEIGDEIDFAVSEAKRLRCAYPGITVVPLFYRVDDNLLYLLERT